MKFVQFTYKESNRPKSIRLGYIDGQCVVDLNGQDTEMPKTMMGFLRNDYFWKRVKDLKQIHRLCTTSLKHIHLLPPVHGVDKVMGISVNYRDYCERHKVEIPTVPAVFNKFPSTITGPSDPVLLRTNLTSKVDYEAELCVVIGRVASLVKEADAYRYVFGYTIAQDITARDWQTEEKNEDQFLLGSSMDTFCHIGPWIVTTDEIGNVDNLNIRCSLNGVCKQNSNTNQLIFKIPQLIERISSVMTLYPGDLILTGTPSGVGMYATPPEYLKPGDILQSEIENIGLLETRIETYNCPERIPRHKEILWPY